MTITHGFELIREQEIAELNTRTRLFRHVQSGAQLLSLENEDENKVFGIVFPTPPADSTGLPHIMEHAVLGGSHKYQVKEPFVELIKGSLYTFVNAMTSADRTSYPVASQNLQDFYNLVDVYLDAVFYPLITSQHLQQEGWHYELEKPTDPLIYKGVVFNEMKGAYSSPDNLLFRYSKQALFPDNVYRFDSGGDPTVIPDLTYEQFKVFHQTYYHPSNAYIFFCGDDPPEERLRLVNEYLKEYTATEVASAVPLQAALDEPQRLTFPYDAGQETNSGQKGMVRVNWLLPENDDPAMTMALSILAYALVGTPASPLRKALIDSGLGEDLTGSGLATQLRQMTFAVGLKGIAAADAGQVEALIFDTLAKLAAEGFEPDMVEAAVNTIEFGLRENNTGSIPRGLSLMFRAMSTWLYGRDPLAPLAFAAPLAAVKERLSQEPGYLPDLIRTYLLQNQHRVTVILEPEPDLRQRLETAEKERLAQAQAAMSEAEVQEVIEATQDLKRWQESVDSAQALASIPRLSLADLDRENKLIPIAVSEAHDSRILYHDLFTNGIVYLDIGLDLHPLPQALLPYVPLFGRALVEMGTEKEDFVKLLQRIGRQTGGIFPSTFTSTMGRQEGSSAWLFLRGKATVQQAADLLAILRDVLLTMKLDDQGRFHQMVLKAKAGKEAGLVPSGNSVVNARLRAHFNEADWVAEQMGGVSNLFFLRQLAESVAQDWPAVQEKLEAIRQILIHRPAMLCNVTLDAANWKRFEPQLQDFLAAFPAAPADLSAWAPPLRPIDEGLTIPAQVNYVGKGADLYRLGYRLHGSIAVITKYLRTTWLWEKVRVQGGAYSSACNFDRRSGVLTFVSYRDPNLLATLDVYDQTGHFLRQRELSQDELGKSIIGAIGAIDAYQLPDAKGYTSMVRYLLGESDEERQQFRDEVLSTSTADFLAFADVLDQVKEEGVAVVMGAQEAIKAADESRGGWLAIQKVL